jgi:hypothetical protein
LSQDTKVTYSTIISSGQVILNLKRTKSVLQKLLAQHRKSGMAAAAGAITVFALAGAWSLAVAQQPYPPPYPQPGYQQPYPQPGYQQPYPQQPGYQQPPANQGRRPSTQELRCMQLEQELANDWVVRQQGRNDGPKLEVQIRKYDRIFQSTQAKAERSRCYQSNFIFGRSLVRTPKCLRLNRQIEDARRQLARLQEQRNAQRGGKSRREQELIAALSRAGCGGQYRQAGRKRRGGGFMKWFEEEIWETTPRRGLETSRIEPFATYRTLCVRSCDGYYFPVSFSTLPGSFSQDISKCQSQCAAPAELYVYRNPGEEAEQMVSSDGRQAYNDHPNAWRYRKEYVKGCSCKAIEYDPNEIAVADAKKEADAEQKKAPGGSAQLKAKTKRKKTP